MSDAVINLTVATQRGVREVTFDVTDKVWEVIGYICMERGLVEGDAVELAFDGQPLAPDSPIGSLGLEDGAALDLVASGTGA